MADFIALLCSDPPQRIAKTSIKSRLKPMVCLSLIHAASIHWKRPSRVIAPSPIDARLPGRCRKAAARFNWRTVRPVDEAPLRPYKSLIKGRLAQLVERFLYTEDVGGSSPSSPTIFSESALEFRPLDRCPRMHADRGGGDSEYLRHYSVRWPCAAVVLR